MSKDSQDPVSNKSCAASDPANAPANNSANAPEVAENEKPKAATPPEKDPKNAPPESQSDAKKENENENENKKRAEEKEAEEREEEKEADDEEEEEEETPKCMVLFRPHEGFHGEYGFDWIRKADEKIKTMTLKEGTVSSEKGNDVDTKDLLGKYNNTGCTKTTNTCGVFTHCRSLKWNNKKVCVDTNRWSTNFIKSEERIYRNLLKNFANIPIQGFDEDDPVPDDYRVPVLTVVKGETITLTIRAFIKDKALEEGLYWKYNKRDKKNNKGIFEFISGEPKVENGKIGNWQKNIEFKLKCYEEFSEDEYIEVYYDNKETNDTNKLCGKLRILANAEKHHTKIKVVFVRVKVNIGNIPKPLAPIAKFFTVGCVGKFRDDDYTTLKNTLQQGHVFIEKDNSSKYPEVELDLSPCEKDFKQEYVDATSSPAKIKSSGLIVYLNSKLDEKYKNEKGAGKYANYFKIYSINEKEEDQSMGFSVVGTNTCVIFKGCDTLTVPHELLHALGLSHTFVHKDVAKYSQRLIDASSKLAKDCKKERDEYLQNAKDYEKERNNYLTSAKDYEKKRDEYYLKLENSNETEKEKYLKLAKDSEEKRKEALKLANDSETKGKEAFERANSKEEERKKSSERAEFYKKRKCMQENALFTYKATETDNVMDYSHYRNINNANTFYWQWKLINKHIS
jgi:hypothetical protein